MNCNCIEQANEQLREHNIRIALDTTVDFKTAEVGISPPRIVTEKIDGKKRKPMPSVYATYCPICGKKC